MSDCLPSPNAILSQAYFDRLFIYGHDHGQPHPAARRALHTPCFEGVMRWAEEYGLAPDGDTEFPEWPEKVQAAVRTAYTAWLPVREAFVRAELTAMIARHSHALPITRAICLDTAGLQALVDNTSPHGLGTFWSHGEASPHWGHDQPGQTVYVHATLDPSRIDWVSTFHRNMDYAYGDEEDEVVLPRGTPVQLTAVRAEGQAACSFTHPNRRA